MGDMIKVNSKCEFGETLDIDAVLATSDSYTLSQYSSTPKQLYYLHSILVHIGSLNSGHYYCFIRPSEQNEWWKFNDVQVTPALKATAFLTGFGGYISHFTVDIKERLIPVNT